MCIHCTSIKVLFVFLTFILLNSCFFSNQVIQQQKSNTECVILLHGMGRTTFSMLMVEWYLLRLDYKVVNFGYPSTSETVEYIAKNRISDAITQCQETSANKIHFVTHSLGGIIVRQYLQTNNLPLGSRIVMLSPPNQGSEISDHFKDSFWYKWSTGAAGQQLTTSQYSLPNQLKPINVETGIITGDKSIEPWFSRLISGKDDGKVSVKSAKLDEMKDFLVVSHTHTFIMWSLDVLKQIENFLKYGKFK